MFELMSWQEGFFSFVEGPVADAPTEAVTRISTESLLMEGARRIDEWARIAHRIPHLAVVPLLAPIDEDHPSLLDLLPNEWEMLAMIDGQSDLRGIAARLGRSEFEVAKIAYGLLSTGIIDVRMPERQSRGPPKSDHARRPASAVRAASRLTTPPPPSSSARGRARCRRGRRRARGDGYRVRGTVLPSAAAVVSSLLVGQASRLRNLVKPWATLANEFGLAHGIAPSCGTLVNRA